MTMRSTCCCNYVTTASSTLYDVLVRVVFGRAVACVEVPPLRENQGVLIGWIQVCTEMRFINSYGKYGV